MLSFAKAIYWPVNPSTQLRFAPWHLPVNLTGRRAIMLKNRSQRQRLGILALCGIAILALPMLLEALPTPEIRFVLPTDFHGGFIIVEDSAGIDWGGPFVRLHTVTVPESRIARVRSFTPFHRWHTESIQFGGGRAPAEVKLGEPDDAVELRSRGFSGREANGIRYRERMSYYFGTFDEAERFDPYSIAATPAEESALSNPSSQ